MPSPFPGMDPYLEAPRHWRELHHGLISFLKIALSAVLPRPYVAHIEERLYVVNPQRNIYPDVAVIEESLRPRRKAKGKAAVATLESDPPLVIMQQPVRIREAFIDLVRTDEPGRVVTTLEMLSPSNKDPGNPGHALYQQKQQQILKSTTHLVEIDLLRRGQHTIAVSRELLVAEGPWDYVVSLHRAENGLCFETWPVTVRQRLPRFRVPLIKGDPDVVVDLQGVFERCYNEYGYADEVDYTQDPRIPLREEDAAWADDLLRRKGLRKRRRRSKNT